MVGIILPSLRVMFVQIAARLPLLKEEYFVPDPFRWGDLDLEYDHDDPLLGPMDAQMTLVEEAMSAFEVLN